MDMVRAAGAKGVTNRQVQQARIALELHYEPFRGIVLAARMETIKPPPHAPAPPAAQAPSSMGRADGSKISDVP